MISKRDYNKALKVVNQYELEQREKMKTSNHFGFLWFDDTRKMNDFTTIVKAKSIESACAKFLAIKPKKLFVVDHEVECNGSYFDISEMKGFENITS